MYNDELYKVILEETLSGYWDWNLVTNERFLSKNLKALLGYEEDEISIEPQSWMQLIHKDDLEKKHLAIKTHYSKTNTSIFEFTARYLHKNGSIKWFLCKGKAILFDNNKSPVRIIGSITDITDLKKKEIENDQLNNSLKNILTSSTNISIISTDTSGIITHFNIGAEKLLGYKAEEVVGIHTPEIIHVREEIIEHGDELSKKFDRNIRGFDAFVEMARQGFYESKHWTYVRKDGTQFPVQLVVSAVKNEQQEIIGFLGIGIDISELSKTQEDLIKTNEHISYQNKKLLDFTYIASHNLKTHTKNINMLLQVLDKKENEEEKKDITNLIKENATSLYSTIEALNEIINIQNTTISEIQLINIAEYVDKVCNILNVEIESIDAKLNLNVSKDVSINYNPIYFESIIFNLMSNAIKYRSSNRKLILSIDLQIVKNKPILTIEDNGKGIDLEKYGTKIFGLFKTFHGNKDARGVGLYITKTQIESMGGNIFLESTLDVGTKFTIYL